MFCVYKGAAAHQVPNEFDGRCKVLTYACNRIIVTQPLDGADATFCVSPWAWGIDFKRPLHVPWTTRWSRALSTATICIRIQQVSISLSFLKKKREEKGDWSTNKQADCKMLFNTKRRWWGLKLSVTINQIGSNPQHNVLAFIFNLSERHSYTLLPSLLLLLLLLLLSLLLLLLLLL